MSATKYMVWFRDRDPETQEWRWDTTGEGPFAKKTAERIAKELGHYLGISARVIAEGQFPLGVTLHKGRLT